MPATSRMWPSMRWMPAVWWRQLRAGAPAGDRRLGKPMLFQTTFTHERLHRVHISSSRPIRRPCLIRSGRAVVVGAAEAAAGVVAAVGAVVQVGVAQAEAAVAVGGVVRGGGGRGGGGKGGPGGR